MHFKIVAVTFTAILARAITGTPIEAGDGIYEVVREIADHAGSSRLAGEHKPLYTPKRDTE